MADVKENGAVHNKRNHGLKINIYQVDKPIDLFENSENQEKCCERTCGSQHRLTENIAIGLALRCHPAINGEVTMISIDKDAMLALAATLTGARIGFATALNRSS